MRSRPLCSRVSAAILLIGVWQLCAAAFNPRLPVPISWSGTRAISAGAFDSARAAVRADTAKIGADTLLRRLKLGVISAHRGRYSEAVTSFERVYNGCPVLAPLAAEQLGDLAIARGDDEWALSAYSSALGTDGLPTRYRNHLFAKIRVIADKDALMPEDLAWLDDYRKWRSRQRLFDAAGLEFVCDSLIKVGKIADADSILETHMPELNKREVCGFIRRVFEQRSADQAKLTTKFLFSIASQASGCRDFDLAERMLAIARTRRDFASAVSARKVLQLEANIAYSRGQWRKAIELFKKFDTAYGADSDMMMNIARAYRQLDNSAEATKWYDRHVKKFPSHSKTQEILWLRAWNHEERGHFKSAADAYRRIFSTKGKRTEEAHFRHALCHYKRQEYDSAVVYLNSFRKKYPNSTYLWGGVFWTGKAQAARGRTEDAHKAWEEIVKLDPADYYAHRARELLKSRADELDSSAAAAAAAPIAVTMSESKARAWLESISPPNKKALSAKDSVDLRRGAALLAIARADLANLFLSEFENNYPNNLVLQYDLASAYAIAGDEARSFSVARRLSWRIPMEHRSAIPLQVMTIMYPPFYAADISKYSAKFGVEPQFVIAVMRQESIFDKNIVSPAGAVGLMQIMPATGRDIAGRLKEPFTADSLYSSSLNIRFGTSYLRHRLDQFNVDKVLALCSYNAGPNNAIKWRDRNKNSDPDLFNEDIGFFETRGYVKKVMGNYWTYAALMNTPGYKFETAKAGAAYPW